MPILGGPVPAGTLTGAEQVPFLNDTYGTAKDIGRFAPAAEVIEFVSDANMTLTAAQAQASAIIFTDSPATLTTGRDVVWPSNFLPTYVSNTTAQTLTLKKSGQTGITLVAGAVVIVASDATDVVRASVGGSSVVNTVNGDTGTVIVSAPICVACSDETTPLTVGTAKVTFRMPYTFTLTAVRASLSTAQTSGSIFTVDINESGSSILSTKITIDNTERTSTTAATAPVISDPSLANDAEITIDIDQVGDGTAKGLKVWLIGYEA